MQKQTKLQLMAYGDQAGNGRGIIELTIDDAGCVQQSCIPIHGKANFALVDGDIMLVPVKEEHGNYLYFYQNQRLMQRIAVTCFYSHGVKGNAGCYYLASYEDGVDAVFDTATMRETCIIHHKRNGCNERSKSHYIGITPDGTYVYGVENGLQQLYVYKVIDQKLLIHDIVEFDQHEGIRLLPFLNQKHAYLNTELSNCIYHLRYDSGRFWIAEQYALTSVKEHSFSGGLAISSDGSLLCASVRGEDSLSCFQIHQDGSLSLIDRVVCGRMPRDIQFSDAGIAVTCTMDHVVELYQLVDSRLVKIQSIPVAQPVTFAITST